MRWLDTLKTKLFKNGSIRVSAGNDVHFDAGPARAPAIDMLENKDGLLVRADIPGAQPDRCYVHLETGNTLTIRAPVEAPHAGYVLAGDNMAATNWFCRIALPASVEPDNARAELTNGVLNISLAKTRRGAFPAARNAGRTDR